MFINIKNNLLFVIGEKPKSYNTTTKKERKKVKAHLGH